MDNCQVEQHRNVHQIHKTCDSMNAPACQERTSMAVSRQASCSSCGKYGNCRKGCRFEKSPLNTSSLTYGSNVLSRPPSTMFCNDERLLTPNDPNYV